MKALLLLILFQLVAMTGCVSESPGSAHVSTAKEKSNLPISQEPTLDSSILDKNDQVPFALLSIDSVAEKKSQIEQKNEANSNVPQDSLATEKSEDLIDEIKTNAGFGSTQTFIKVVLILIFIYLLLSLADRFLVRRNFLGREHKTVANWIHNLFIIYEPFALLLITVSFILINPLFFGLIVLIILLISIRHLRNYFSGRLVQLDKSIEIGRQIKTADNQGIIHQITRFGIRLKTAKGLQFLTYPQLIWPGYTLSAGEDLGGFYRLIISKDNDEPMDTIKLKDLITTVPYLDWNHDTELSMSYDQPGQVRTKVLVREDHHLQNLIALIKEWGYTCKVSKK